MMFSKTIQKVLTLKMYFPYFICATSFQAALQKIWASNVPAEIGRSSYFRLATLCPKFPGQHREKFLFKAGNSEPEVPVLKQGKVLISGQQHCTPSSWAEMRESSYYFRVATLCFKFPGCNREKFLFPPRNSAPQVPGLKLGKVSMSGQQLCGLKGEQKSLSHYTIPENFFRRIYLHILI